MSQTFVTLVSKVSEAALILFWDSNGLNELPEVNVRIFKFLSCYRLNELPDVHFCVSFMLIGKLTMALVKDQSQ